MVEIGADCLLKNTNLKKRIQKMIPIINVLLGKKNGRPTFRAIYNELKDRMGIELDLDSFAEMYKSEIPERLRFTSDEKIERILNSRTKILFDNLTMGVPDRIDGIGTTSTDRAAIHKTAQILTHIEGKDNSTRTKTMAKIVKDAILASIQRLANTNEAYREAKTVSKKATFDETLEKVLEINSLSTRQITADKFNTIHDVMDQARTEVLKSMTGLEDEDGEPVLGAEALNFLDQYKNAVFSTLMSSADANTIIRGALIDKFGKGTGDKRVVDWKKIAGEINSPSILRENVIQTLQEGKGFTRETAESIADAMTNEFKDLVQGQKAMNVKYALAETEASSILKKLSWPEDATRDGKMNKALHDAIDESVATSDEINISDIVHNVLENVVGVKSDALANIPKSLKIKSTTADRIANIVKGDGELDSEALAKLYGTLGKVVDQNVIDDLRRLSKLKNDINNIDITINQSTGRLSDSKQGLAKAKAIQSISNEMARIVANSYDYSKRSLFYKMTTSVLNGVSTYLSANTALVLLNPFNLTQNILSGAFVGVQGKAGGWIYETFGGKYKTPLTYTYTIPGSKNEKAEVDLTSLLNMSGKFDTWWNTLLGANGRDIPDLFTGDASKEVKTLQTAKTKTDKTEAYLSLLPRAALTATDSMLKEPYFRKELIRGILYHLQATGKATKEEAQTLVYEALTGNSNINLMKQARQLAAMTGKENDKYFVKQIAEDIQLSSLILFDSENKPILTEQNLQSIIDAAKQTSSEAFGHVIQKDVFMFNFLYDLMTGAKAKAIEGLNKQYGDRMKDLYSRGEYRDAAWLHFTHTFKTSVGFLFQRGIYNWAILMAQKNPLSIITGFKALARETNFHDAKAGQDAVENYLRSRAKIGRGVMGTATAAVVIPLILASLKQGCGDDKDCIHDKLEALKKDPVWGRMYRNFVSPMAQSFLDGYLSDNLPEGIGSGLEDMAITPIVSAGSKYYSVDNVLLQTVENFKKGKLSASGANVGGMLSVFVPFRGFLSTNKALWDRATSANSPGMIDKNFEIITDDRKRPKEEGFWDAFWY